MAITYFGDLAAHQAPSPIPGINEIPAGVLPEDTDDDSASAWYQLAKALYDVCAYMNRIHLFAQSTDALALGIGPLQTCESGHQKKRWGVDFAGMPCGRISQIQENFIGADLASYTSPTGALTPYSAYGQLAFYLTAHGTVAVSNNTAGPNWNLEPGLTLNSTAVIGNIAGIQSANKLVALRNDCSLQGSVSALFANMLGDSHINAFLGFFDDPAALYSTSNFMGFGYVPSVSTVNWCSVLNDGAVPVVTDLGVAIGSYDRLQVRYLGSGETAGGVRAVEWWINDVLVKTTVTSRIPAATVKMYFGGNLLCVVNNATTGRGMVVSPWQVAFNQFPEAVF